MTTIYTFDAQKIYAGAVDVDPLGPVPPGTLDAPPETTGDEVAQWTGDQWTVLPSRPLPPPVQPPTRTRADVLADLAAIDTRSIRALREGNTSRIAGLEAQAVALRAELAALVTATSQDDLDFSTLGPMPHSVPELQVEIGL